MELRNNRSGEVINSDLTHEEACKQFAQLYGRDDSHWLLFWIHKACLDKPKAETQAALTFLADMFLIAVGYQYLIKGGKSHTRHRKPTIRCHYKDRRFKFYLSSRGTICLKTGGLNLECYYCGCGECKEGYDCPMPVAEYGRDPVGDEVYAGCLSDGKFLLPRFGETRNLLDTEKEFLEKLEADPVKFLADCSKDMGRCCYCNLPLEDPISKRVGYGKICASRWGLPWGDKRYMEKAPSFAKCYDADAAGILQAVRDSRTPEAWDVLGDWLEENKLPRCKRPSADVVLPRG